MTRQRCAIELKTGITLIVAIFAGALAGCGAAGCGPAASQKAFERDRYLLLDSRLIDETDNARLAVGAVTRRPANPLFGQTLPWELDISHMYPNVVYDEKEQLYKVWYYTKIAPAWGKHITPGPLAPKQKARGNLATLYAVSKDGVKWAKPALDLYRYKGKPTNIVVWGDHGTGVFRDSHDTDPQRRYKLISLGKPNRNLDVAFSPDGIHWGRRFNITKARGDTHNNALWAPDLNKYVAFTRAWRDRIRLVLRTESADFVKWSTPVEVFRGPREAQIYSMPVFRHAGVYLGLPAIFHTAGDLKGRVATELAWSPDTKTWHRIDEGSQLIPLAEKPGAYDWGCIYAAASPVVLPDEIRIYYSMQKEGHSWQPGWLGLATLRPDGWAGYVQQDKSKPAAIVTNRIRPGGKMLRITADIPDGGMVKVTVLDVAGKALAQSAPIAKTATDSPVRWAAGFSLAKLNGKPIRLRFILTNAKLYSFSFGD